MSEETETKTEKIERLRAAREWAREAGDKGYSKELTAEIEELKAKKSREEGGEQPGASSEDTEDYEPSFAVAGMKLTVGDLSKKKEN